MRIALDIDDVLAHFMKAYNEKFNTEKHPYRLKRTVITRNVHQKLKNDRNFWLSLEVKHRPNFIPELYCTKRVNPKSYTKKWLEINNFPKRPVYQMLFQHGNKADIIKGRCDVLIDDSYDNVVKALDSGLPAILLTTSYNEDINFKYRVKSLDLNEIERVYENLVNDFKRN